MAEARRVCPTCGSAYGGEALFCPRDGAPLASRGKGGLPDPHVGLCLDGRIRLERLAGIGSMGRVYRAHQAGLDRPVAVKILHPEHALNETLVARFHREGRVAAGLLHPHVVAVHASGELPARADRAGETPPKPGEPYLVMEFLDGLSLRSALSGGGGALPLARALHVVLQIADAMGEAHAHGIVHRDLKPENVMLVTRGVDPDFVKVLDFGVARVGEADSSLATHAGAILGTATYACPESARGDHVGPRGDVYAIATLLFECLAGRPPFQGPGPVDVLIQHAQAVAPDVRSLSPPHAAGASVPEALAQLIARNLSKNPESRAADARAFGLALLDAVPGGGPGEGLGLLGARTLIGTSPRNRAEKAARGPSGPETTAVMAAAPERTPLTPRGPHETSGERSP